MKDNKKVVLIIRDGMGINPSKEYNAVAAAHTPVNDSQPHADTYKVGIRLF